jgi:hypothetical protein
MAFGVLVSQRLAFGFLASQRFGVCSSSIPEVWPLEFLHPRGLAFGVLASQRFWRLELPSLKFAV